MSVDTQLTASRSLDAKLEQWCTPRSVKKNRQIYTVAWQQQNWELFIAYFSEMRFFMKITAEQVQRLTRKIKLPTAT